MTMSKLLTLLSEEIGYLLRDEFSTDRAAGAANGTPAEPGPGKRTIVDTESKITISSGTLVFAGGRAAPGYGDPSYYLNNAIARSTGLTVLFKMALNTTLAWNRMGWNQDGTTTPGRNALGFFSGGGIYIFDNPGANILVDAAYTATTYTVAICLRAAGAFYLIKGGAYSAWTLLWIGVHDTTTPVYLVDNNHSQNCNVEYYRAARLPYPWNDAFGIVTQRMAGARANGDQFTHAANCLIEWTATTVAATQQVSFRLEDVDNCWRVDAAADGSLILYEVVAGTPTSRGTGAAGSVANGQRVVVIADGTTIKVFANNVLKITYATANNFATCTAGQIDSLGEGGAISDLVIWPRTLGGSAAALLDKHTR